MPARRPRTGWAPGHLIWAAGTFGQPGGAGRCSGPGAGRVRQAGRVGSAAVPGRPGWRSLLAIIGLGYYALITAPGTQAQKHRAAGPGLGSGRQDDRPQLPQVCRQFIQAGAAVLPGAGLPAYINSIALVRSQAGQQRARRRQQRCGPFGQVPGRPAIYCLIQFAIAITAPVSALH